MLRDEFDHVAGPVRRMRAVPARGKESTEYPRAMRTAVMVLLLVLSACGKGPLSGNQSAACETDSDCTIDCTTGSNCCGPLCRCEVAITRAQAKANRADYERRCEGKELDCPVASCPQPNDTLAAKCQAHRCVVEGTPRP
jgi:hypothetical protein